MERLLLVEDDETLRETLALNLERQGYTVEQAVDGEEALDKVREDPPDLIVDVYIRWLRKKVEEDPSQPKLIQTVRGVGYRLEAPAEQ